MDYFYGNTENEGGPSKLSSGDIPVLTLPKNSTSFDVGSSSSDEIVINLNITTKDVDGNALNLYSGLCNIKFIDTDESESLVPLEDYAIPTDNEDDVNDIFTESKWLKVVDENDIAFDIDESNPGAGRPVTVEHHNTYITQNIINYGGESFVQYDQEQQQDDESRSVLSRADLNYEDFVAEMHEEVIIDDVDNEEPIEDVDFENRDNALKQLLTTNLIGSHKQSKTIVFTGKDFLQGHTIQKISFNDPNLKCRKKRRAKQVRIADLPNPNQKKYQCDQCKDIFIDIASFKEHIGIHQTKVTAPPKIPVNYICTICSRVLKSQKKIKIHAQGHGDPNLECSQCFQVFASKLTCKKHEESHKKKISCAVCNKKFQSAVRMKRHQTKMHSNQICEVCDFVATTFEKLVEHVKTHDYTQEKQETTTIAVAAADSQDPDEVDLITFDDFQELEEEVDEATMEVSLPYEDENAGVTDDSADEADTDKDQTRKEANSVMQKVISSNVFQKKYKTARVLKELKTCDVCMKSFDRMSDLKRHLIEHFIKCTAATTPINEDGTFDILCGICEKAFFTDFNSYKDHLRKHAKLTIYRCTICSKSFSDSSNFSKHKKIHGVSYFQCDLCSRRFHSKKMIAQHMDYHSQHKPITCKYCGKIYHFQSNLNKHIRAAHNKRSNRFRCRYCEQLLLSVKEKWDHEWNVHNVRRVLADCEICDAKFRKYSELKQHCKKYHSFEILVVDGEIPIDTNLESLQFM